MDVAFFASAPFFFYRTCFRYGDGSVGAPRTARLRQRVSDPRGRPRRANPRTSHPRALFVFYQFDSFRCSSPCVATPSTLTRCASPFSPAPSRRNPRDAPPTRCAGSPPRPWSSARRGSPPCRPCTRACRSTSSRRDSDPRRSQSSGTESSSFFPGTPQSSPPSPPHPRASIATG